MRNVLNIALVIFAFMGWQMSQAIAQNAEKLEFTCRYYGHDYKIKEQICLATSKGLRVATCGMELNNSSWIIGPLGCAKASEKKPRITSKARKYIEQYIRDYGQQDSNK
jgi:hypothetical protein